MEDNEDHREILQSLAEEWAQNKISERIIQGCANGDSFALECVNFNEECADQSIPLIGTGATVDSVVKKIAEVGVENLEDLIVRDEAGMMLPTKQRKGWWESSRFEPRQAIEHLNRNLPQ